MKRSFYVKLLIDNRESANKAVNERLCVMTFS